MNWQWVVNIVLILIVIYITTRRENFGYRNTKSNNPFFVDEKEFDLKRYSLVDTGKLTPDMLERMVHQTNERISHITGLCTYIIETIGVNKYKNKETDEEVYRATFMVVKHGGMPFAFVVTSDIKILNDPTSQDNVSGFDVNLLKQAEQLHVDPTTGEVTATYESTGEVKTRLDKTALPAKKYKDEKIRELASIIQDNDLSQQQREEKASAIISEILEGIKNKQPVVMVHSIRTQPLDYNYPQDPMIYTNNFGVEKYDDYTKVRESEINFIKGKKFKKKEIMSSNEMYKTAREPVSEDVEIVGMDAKPMPPPIYIQKNSLD